MHRPIALRASIPVVLLGLAAGMAAPARAVLDDFYYNYEEIHSELAALASQYPQYVRLDSLGFSYATNTPIWGVKISDNVQVEEDEPAFWVGGQCHAEEILGVSIAMEFAHRLVELGSLGHPIYGPFLEAMEIHIVPSYNPDGLGVVMSGQDVTYRKNLHSFAEDGHCHIAVGMGGDSCGVDLNRNFPGWWDHGMELWEPGSAVEQFDYFRGPSEGSEPEVQAIMRQTERERFVAGVAYHSARRSTNHEIIIYPWHWEEHTSYTCPGPDYEMSTAAADGMAAVVDGYDYHPYRTYASSTRAGFHNNFLYSQYGGLGFTIEVGLQGGDGMQPENQTTIDFIVNENIDGLNWLCRRIIGYEVAAPGLVAHVKDSANRPLAARLRLEEVMHPDCVTWYRTDPDNGSYFRLLAPRSYTLKLRKHGYVGQDTQVVVGNGGPTERTYTLAALPRHELALAFQTLEDGQPLEAQRIELLDLASDTLLTFEDPGMAFSMALPQGAYELTAWFAERIPVHQTLVLDGPLSLSPPVSPRQGDGAVFTRVFDSLDDFTQLGANCGWNHSYVDSLGWQFQDSPDPYSRPGTDCRLATAESWSLDLPVRDLVPGALEFVEYHELEGGMDSAYVEFSRDGGASWTPVRSFTGPGRRVVRRSLPIGTEWASGEFRFAFRVKTNGVIEDAGFHVADVRLSWNGNVSAVDPAGKPASFSLSSHPNPFNPLATLRLAVPAGVVGARMSTSLFDVAGHEVRRLAERGGVAGGTTDVLLDASGLPSGTYYARVVVEAGGVRLWQGVQPVTLLK